MIPLQQATGSAGDAATGPLVPLADNSSLAAAGDTVEAGVDPTADPGAAPAWWLLPVVGVLAVLAALRRRRMVANRAAAAGRHR